MDKDLGGMWIKGDMALGMDTDGGGGDMRDTDGCITRRDWCFIWRGNGA
jgi:hypothetical protein